MPIRRQLSFASGELSPSLFARTDLAKYATGLRACRNFQVMKSGGVENRPGTEFIAEVKDSTKAVRLIPFVFSRDQSYVLEFGNGYARIYRLGVIQELQDTVSISAITNASPARVTFGAGFSNYVDGDRITISGATGMTQINGGPYWITRFSYNEALLYTDQARTIPLNSSAFGAYLGGGISTRYFNDLTTPYQTADLPELQFAQSGDVLSIVHPSHPPIDLTRHSEVLWSTSYTFFGPMQGAPSAIGVSGGIAGTASRYKVTAVNDDTGEESYTAGPVNNGSNAATSGNPITLSITRATGASRYLVYKQSIENLYGYIGATLLASGGGNTFVDNGITPVVDDNPPEKRNPFADPATGYTNPGSNYNPAAIAYYQQRRVFASTNTAPETVWASRSGLFSNFTVSYPMQDDDAVTFSIAGKSVSRIRHIIDFGRLVILTDSGEHSCGGDVFTPTNINRKQHSSNGCHTLAPLIANTSLLYVQAGGSVVRELAYSYQEDNYGGPDLTVFSDHLLRGKTVVDWTYQKLPHSIVWAVRSDGVLLGLTYIREHELVGWHRHDTAGSFENVCSVPEGTEEAVYVVVKRTIGGVVKRFIERLRAREFETAKDAFFVDSGLTYDGRNTATTDTVHLTSAGGWTENDTLTLTLTDASGDNPFRFTSTDVGNAVFIYDEDGELVLRFTIDAYTSATVVTGRSDRNVPADFQGAGNATANWAKAVDVVEGLGHLIGEEVSVLADGYVLSSPNNTDYPALVVDNAGKVTLPGPFAVIHVGLPYISDLETLDLDSDTLADKKKRVGKVTLYVEKSMTAFVGPSLPEDDASDALDGLNELKLREAEDYDDPIALTTNNVDVQIRGEWNSNGRVATRNTEPTPLTILAIKPDVHIGS